MEIYFYPLDSRCWFFKINVTCRKFENKPEQMEWKKEVKNPATSDLAMKYHKKRFTCSYFHSLLWELPICSWEIEQILLFLQDKWSFSAWVNNSKLHFIRLLMPWAKFNQSEKCNGPHKTCRSQKNAMVPVKHVVSCFTVLLVQNS